MYMFSLLSVSTSHFSTDLTKLLVKENNSLSLVSIIGKGDILEGSVINGFFYSLHISTKTSFD